MAVKSHSTRPERMPAPTRTENIVENTSAVSVLLIEEQRPIREVCEQVIGLLGYNSLVAESGAQALEIMERVQIDIVIVDIKMPGASGRHLLQEMKSRNPRVEIAIVTSDASVSTAVQAMKLGASDYIIKPFSPEEIRIVIERLARTLLLKDENRYLRERLQSGTHFAKMVGPSQQMQQVFKMIQKAAASRAPVLILGESGTGKELAAQSIHEVGPWRDQPFVPIDCAALPPTLIESELFGHVRGAFTGATNTKEGLLETAREGTLFFDEIAELPVDLQARLLRTLQEREFRPLGSTRRLPFRSRIIAATNRNLKAAVQQGSFRKDLYFRLNVVSLTMPPLRDRKLDIPLLADHILRRLSSSATDYRTKAPWVLSSEALERLLAYDWPGNVRELENALERAVTMSSGPLIRTKDLPSTLQSLSPLPASGFPESIIPMDEMERQAIERALASTGGDKLQAARLLKIGKTTLYRKLNKYQKKV
jgi:DNA-binding NtrC family response regulator